MSKFILWSILAESSDRPMTYCIKPIGDNLNAYHTTSTTIIFGVKLKTHEYCYEPKFHEDRTIGSGVKSKKLVFRLGPFIGGFGGLAGWNMA